MRFGHRPVNKTQERIHMPEISEERLAYFEALEALAKSVIEPLAQDGEEMAETEYQSRFARTWSDEEIESAMHGSAIWDDRPKGWRKSTLLTYSRGYLVGRGLVGGNIGQYFSKIVKAAHDPVGYWRRWRLGYLELCKGSSCSCGGTYTIDSTRIGIECNQCHAFFTYDQVRERSKQSA
jgi:hypothetical protein